MLSVAAALRLDAATAEVLERFAHAGVHAVLLKGPSLVGWLYPADSAHYTDADILVRPSDEPGAATVLSALGFEPALDDSSMPAWWREHGAEWSRPEDKAEVDLHRRLLGVGLDPSAAWPLLTADGATVTVAGYPAPVLAPRARLLHVTLHAAQHGPGKEGKALLHLERALDVVSRDDWVAATNLATQLDAMQGFAAGLRRVPRGAALADELGLPAVTSVDAALRVTSPPPTALGFEQLARAPGGRARVEIGLRKLFPPREFLVHWDPRAAQSRVALARARVRRPLWVLGSAPRGFRAWWRARRATR